MKGSQTGRQEDRQISKQENRKAGGKTDLKADRLEGRHEADMHEAGRQVPIYVHSLICVHHLTTSTDLT